MKAYLHVLAMFGVLATPANAQDIGSGNALIEHCRAVYSGNARNAGSTAFCLGLISGIVDGHNITTHFAKSDKLWCNPKSVVREQMVRIVVSYMDKNPDKLHYPLSEITVLALMDAFPCN